MLRYELKKILKPLGGKIALLLLAASVAVSCWAAAVDTIGTEWSNEQGQRVSGRAAIVQLRKLRKEWAGPLDTERLTAAIRENQRIEATPEARSGDARQTDIAYGWKRGISDIREVVNTFLAEGFQDYNYYLADSISLDRLPGLYENRVKLVTDWLYEEGSSADNRYSEAEKQWIIRQYTALKTPMDYDYFLGWQQVLHSSDMIIMFLSLVLGYLVAGIFANEFKWKVDPIYFSSMLGRTTSTRAKIGAGFLLVTAAYWVCIFVYTLFTLCWFGFDGWNCPVQLDRWKSFYNLTFLESYLLILLGGYLGNLFTAFLVMWVSARGRSAVVATTVPFLLIFLPSFLQSADGRLIAKILALLPDRLLQLNNAINYFDLYTIGSQVTGAVPVLLTLYPFLTAALVPVMYREFRRKGSNP